MGPWATVVLWAAGCWPGAADEPALQKFRYSERHMGVEFKLILYAPEAASANRAAQAAFDRIAALNRCLSDYDPESETMRMCAAGGPGKTWPASPDLLAILTKARHFSEESGSAFDVSVGPLVQLWRRSRRQKQLPSAAALALAKPLVGYDKIRLDPQKQTVELLVPGMRLDFGGIAQGYAADEALAVLRTHGITRALVDASGDVSAGEPPPDREHWRVGLAPLEADAPPREFLDLARRAVSTSGDAFQYVELEGQRYAHIIDPQTGLGLTRRCSATVVAPDGTTADALATAICILGPEKGLALADRWPEVAARLVTAEDGQVRSHVSRRWGALTILKPARGTSEPLK